MSVAYTLGRRRWLRRLIQLVAVPTVVAIIFLIVNAIR